MSAKQLYSDFKKQFQRMTGREDMQEFVQYYIYEYIPPVQFMKLFDKEKRVPLFTEELLKNGAVNRQALIILTIMEASENEKEFQELFDKRTAKKDETEQESKELEGFDKILAGIMKVPKPREDKKETGD